MDATLSGHQSQAAAVIVRTFVDALPPEYPERLRRVILSSPTISSGARHASAGRVAMSPALAPAPRR
jgi:hypothetical protein